MVDLKELGIEVIDSSKALKGVGIDVAQNSFSLTEVFLLNKRMLPMAKVDGEYVALKKGSERAVITVVDSAKRVSKQFCFWSLVADVAPLSKVLLQVEERKDGKKTYQNITAITSM